MQRNQQSTSSTPLHLRRNHARHQEQPWPGFTFGSNLLRFHGETPDLSVHLPPKPFSNRFEVLAIPTPPPETEAIREFHVSTRYRRSRNSRGTKEAKRRRDARRSRRKMAAQMLDEQLSRDIDFALSKVDGLRTPPSSVPSPTPVLPTASMLPTWPMYLPPLPPSPPQLPALKYPGFGDTNSFEYDTARTTPLPSTPSLPTIPSWCPPLPCFTRKGIWSEGLPIFYDLSSLPEPKEGPKPARDPKLCRELQLWRGNLDLKPKQSRFFPSTPSPTKPRVKLPSNACKLHLTEKGLPDAAPDRPTTYADAVRKGIDEDPVEIAATVDTVNDVRPATSALEPSAANLWNILTEIAWSGQHNEADPYLANFEPSSDNDSYLAVWQTHINTAQQAEGPVELDGRKLPYVQANIPAELDSKELPYVHANSLTGVSNDIMLSPYGDEHPALGDSAVCFTPLSSPPIGLNELMVDYDMGLPYTVQSETITNDNDDESPVSVQHSLVLANILPIDCIREEDGGEETLKTSDAHFQSEQSLFRSPSSPSETPVERPIDVASFLKLGHATNCWCSDCYPSPELSASDKDTDTPELVPFDKLTEMDDDWMLYSATDDQSIAIQPSDATGDDEKHTSRSSCGTAPVWDDFFPCKPHPTCEAKIEQRDDEESRFGSSDDFDWV